MKAGWNCKQPFLHSDWMLFCRVFIIFPVKKSQIYIQQGLVKVNWKTVENPAFECGEVIFYLCGDMEGENNCQLKERRKKISGESL